MCHVSWLFEVRRDLRTIIVQVVHDLTINLYPNIWRFYGCQWGINAYNNRRVIYLSIAAHTENYCGQSSINML